MPAPTAMRTYRVIGGLVAWALGTAWLPGAASAAAASYAATATGYEYVASELPDGTVVAETSQVYFMGGPDVTFADGNGVFGPGFAHGGPVYSYASLATGTLYATGDWSTQYYGGPNNLLPGPTVAQAALADTITFANAPKGAMGQLVLNTNVAEVDGLGEIMETMDISSGGVGGSISQTLTPKGATLQVTSSNGSSCSCTQTSGAWTSKVSVLFPLLSGVPYIVEDSVDAQTYEPNPIPLYPSTVAMGIAEIDPTWSLILPAGVTYTTASGYQLGTSTSTGTGPTTGAPEPDAAAMMLLGLALCGSRRRSRVANCAASASGVG